MTAKADHGEQMRLKEEASAALDRLLRLEDSRWSTAQFKLFLAPALLLARLAGREQELARKLFGEA